MRLRSIILLTVIFGTAIAVTRYFNSGTPGAAPSSELLRQRSAGEIRADIESSGAPVTVVNFWASWCEPCKRELPLFLRLQRERSVRLMLISVDDASDFAEAENVLKANGIDFPTYYKGRQSLNFVADLYPGWSGAIPATIIFGAGGEIVKSWEGETTWPELDRNVPKKRARP